MIGRIAEFFKRFYIFLILYLIIFIFYGLFYWYVNSRKQDEINLRTNGVVTMADIKPVFKEIRNKEIRLFEIEYTFDVNGKKYEGVADISQNPNEMNKPKIRISYDPDDPGRNIKNDPQYFATRTTLEDLELYGNLLSLFLFIGLTVSFGKILIRR